MTTLYKCEVRNDIDSLHCMRNLWNDLAHTMKEGFVCHSYEWFECWYLAFCKKGNERIVLVYERDHLRAILPGMITERNVRGISCTAFSYAGNGHSPRCGVIALQGDDDAIVAAITFVSSYSIGATFDFSIFMGIMSGTDTSKAIQRITSNFKIHIEHSFYSPTCDISKGWERYLEGRSKSLRERVKKAFNRTKRMGVEPTFEIVAAHSNVEETLERLSRVEIKTWQYRNGTGLFSTYANSTFYRSLITKLMYLGLVRVTFVSIREREIAYELYLVNSDVVSALKIGYDPEFAKCSPGILSLYFSIKYYADNGFQEYDLIGEKNDEKTNWATRYQEHSNFWIFNSRSFKGGFIQSALRVHTLIKKAISCSKRDTSRPK